MNRKLERLLNEGHKGNTSLAELKKQTNELAERLEYTEFKKFCGRMRNSAEYLKITTTQGKNKVSKNLSHIRFEPLTSHHRQQKTWAQFNANLPALIEKYPNHQWLFITLTIQNCDVNNLRDQYKYLNSSFSNLLKMPEFKKYFSQNGKYYKNKNGERNCGYFKVLEASKSLEFNHCKPHLHLLLHLPKNFEDSKNYISKELLQALWTKACNVNYRLHVDIVRIKNDENLVSNVCGFASYMTKPHDLHGYTDDYIITYIQQIDRFQLSTYVGTLSKIKKSSSSDYQKSDSNDDADNNYKCMRYNNHSNRYEEYKIDS